MAEAVILCALLTFDTLLSPGLDIQVRVTFSLSYLGRRGGEQWQNWKEPDWCFISTHGSADYKIYSLFWLRCWYARCWYCREYWRMLGCSEYWITRPGIPWRCRFLRLEIPLKWICYPNEFVIRKNYLFREDMSRTICFCGSYSLITCIMNERIIEQSSNWWLMNENWWIDEWEHHRIEGTHF